MRSHRSWFKLHVHVALLVLNCELALNGAHRPALLEQGANMRGSTGVTRKRPLGSEQTTSQPPSEEGFGNQVTGRSARRKACSLGDK